ncbi:hypothetical protein ACFFJX_09395 [Pseudarcicella hirudinis]|uniref:hypothetical protein n=2 Tax=Pseudarcicella hirudinis TaxID=1079859 RepID=UPI0035EDEAAF
MIRKFVYTSSHIEGEVVAGFDKETQLLVFFDLRNAELTFEQHVAFMQSFPRCLDELEQLVYKDPANRRIIEIEENLTFEQFWERYAHKQLSNKKRTQVKWNKMTEAERLKAFLFIPKYEHLVMKQGIQKACRNLS